ncbi:WYL domain-containing protein [Vreelandella titanicae]|uniref:WYL domain-containing protein n=1 Tax=Vreelandella titanicae TaxID=664683 RepID=UPI0039BEE052
MNEKLTRSGRWGQERRLEFIDFRLLWEGRLNRFDLTSFFKISVPQASLYLAKYQEIAPHNLSYDRTLKTYVASKSFKPILTDYSSSDYLNELLLHEHNSVAPGVSFIGWAPPVSSLPTPTRRVEPEILIGILRALQKNNALKIDYQSLASFDDVKPRKIYPTSFSYDGSRWNIRAYCFKTNKFKDYVLGRIRKIIETIAPPSNVPIDTEWETYIDVIIGPNPNYPELKKRAIEDDYQMVDGETKLRIREAQLYYLVRRLNLNKHPKEKIEDHQQIVMLRIENHQSTNDLH